MTTICFVVLVALFGTANSSCKLGIQTDNFTDEVTVCTKGCCDEYCCIDLDGALKDMFPDLDDAAETAQKAGYMIFVVVNVFFIVAVIGIISAIVTCCYCCWCKRQRTGFVIHPQQASFSEHHMNQMYSGYNQAPSRSPPRYADKQNVMYNRLPDNDA